jgi:hypothetical protein
MAACLLKLRTPEGSGERNGSDRNDDPKKAAAIAALRFIIRLHGVSP